MQYIKGSRSHIILCIYTEIKTYIHQYLNREGGILRLQKISSEECGVEAADTLGFREMRAQYYLCHNHF